MLRQRNCFYETNPDVFRQAVNSFERVFSEYKEVTDIIRKATNCLNYIIKYIISMGLPKSGDDNDWEKIIVNLLSLIEVNDDLVKFKLFNIIKCIVFY